MSVKSRNVYLKVARIKRDFLALGFRSRTAFFNVVKSIYPKVNDFELILFYDHDACSSTIIHRLEIVLEYLRKE